MVTKRKTTPEEKVGAVLGLLGLLGLPALIGLIIYINKKKPETF